MPITIPSCRISFEGGESSMKTSTALTAPYPSILLAFDGGFERALFGKAAKNFEGLDIHIVEFDREMKPDQALEQWRQHDITIFRLQRPIQTDPIRKRGFLELWNYFNGIVAKAAGDKEHLRSVIVDTMTLARETRADGHLQRYQDNTPAGQTMRVQLVQIEYGVVNDAIKDIYLNFESTGVNLIATHHLTEERTDQPVTNKDGTTSIERLPTGKMIIGGYNKTYQYVDMALRMELKQERVKVDGRDVTQAYSQATFRKSGFNPDLMDTSMKNLTWNKLMTRVEDSLGGTLLLPKSKIAPLEG